MTPRSAPSRGARRRVLRAWRSTAVESAAPRGLCPASCRADSAEHDAACIASVATPIPAAPMPKEGKGGRAGSARVVPCR